MDLDLLGFSLSIGLCLCMLGLACDARKKVARRGKTPSYLRLKIDSRDFGSRSVAVPFILLRVLLLGRAADDAEHCPLCMARVGDRCMRIWV